MRTIEEIIIKYQICAKREHTLRIPSQYNMTNTYTSIRLSISTPSSNFKTYEENRFILDKNKCHEYNFYSLMLSYMSIQIQTIHSINPWLIYNIKCKELSPRPLKSIKIFLKKSYLDKSSSKMLFFQTKYTNDAGLFFLYKIVFQLY